MSNLPSTTTSAAANDQRKGRAASFDLDARIGIIGAGAAGITVARALTKKGFRRVTVLERDSRVGGKCNTVTHEGRSYELGALALSPRYHNVRALAKELGLKPESNADRSFPGVNWRRSALLPPLCMDIDSGRATHWPTVLSTEPLKGVAASCLRLGLESFRARDTRTPGHSLVPREMSLPFEEWTREARITGGARLIVDPLVTPLGYGYLNETPAAYILKYLSVAAAPPFRELLEGGFQGLWEAAARGLDVRLDVKIRSVKRAEQVVVETDRGEWTFDALVLTSPLDEALSFLDATAEEAELAAKIKYNDYRVVIASASGLPEHRYVLLPKHVDPSTRGEVLFWHKRWNGSDVYTFYAYGREGSSIDETVMRVSETVRRVGGALKGVHYAKKWRYFPHVSTEDLARGFFERMEAMQGARHTYYAGELLSFAIVETVMSQAYDLVKRHFAVSREGSRAAGKVAQTA